MYMTGGLMQLVAYGAQDIYLTGNPMITYFKVVYRRHTNFAMESIQQVFNGAPGFGSRATALISRNGDLVSGMTLEVDLPALVAGTRWTDDVGHHLIEQVDVEIGGQLIDRHYADWLEIWAQLTVPASQVSGYREMIGQSPKDNLGRPTGLQLIGDQKNATRIYVPLQFWFCRNVGLALPLIALQYHEVKLTFTFRSAGNLIMAADNAAGTLPTGTMDASLWVDYIYLDTDERRRFAQVSHEYLIEQLQVNDKAFDNTTVNMDLTLNHPVKELVWVARYTDVEAAKQWSNYTNITALTAANVDQSVQAENDTSVVTAAYGAAVALTDATVGNGFTLGINVSTAGRSALSGTATLNVAVGAGDILLINGTSYIVATGGAAGVVANASAVRIIYNGGVVAATNLIATGALLQHVTYTAAAQVITENNLDALLPTASVAQNFTRPAASNSTLAPNFASNPVSSAILKLNGHNRFSSRNGAYFNRTQTRCHTCIPASPGINVYSFALKPEDHQPSGTCNFSRIDNAKLVLTLNAGLDADGVARANVTGNVKVFATNYNVLRIMSGMGGLAYSN
jgi:hypothetical protein